MPMSGVTVSLPSGEASQPLDRVPRRPPVDVLFADIARGDRHPQRRTRFAIGPRGSGKARQTVTAFAPIAFCNIQRHRAKRASELLPQVAIEAPNATHNRRKHLDGMDGEVENVKRGRRAMRRSCLHAPFKRTNRDSAPRNQMTNLALARFFRARAGKQDRRIAHP